MAEIPVTCPDIDVIFDVPDTEADDHDDTWQAYELLNNVIGA